MEELIHKKCKTCKKTCKQPKTVKIIKCNYEKKITKGE